MGWSNCGTDSQGRPIGYAHGADCDHPGCDKAIDRGLAYACGGGHGVTEFGCERYFCSEHLSVWVSASSGPQVRICDECAQELLKSGDWEKRLGELCPKGDWEKRLGGLCPKEEAV